MLSGKETCIKPAAPRYQKTNFLNLKSNIAGQGLVEYLVIVIVVAIVVIVGIRYFGGSLTEQFQNATGDIDALSVDSKSPMPVGSVAGNDSSLNGISESEEEEVFSGRSSASDSSPTSVADESAEEGEISALKKGGVGDGDVDPIEEIAVDWTLLSIIGVVAALFAIALLLKERKKLKKGEKKGKDKKDKKASKGAAKKGDAGQAMVEFLFISITFLFVILGIIQLAMVMNAYALVRYAAYNASRAAVVHAYDPVLLEEKMHDAARMSLLPVFPRHGRADHVTGLVENYMAASSTDGGGSPPLDQDPGLTFFGDPITRVEILPINGVASGEVVTFDDFVEGRRGRITVQVTHFYELVMPLVNRILFYVYQQFREGTGPVTESLTQLSSRTNQLRRSGEYVDIEYRIPIRATYTARLHTDLIMP